MLKGVLTLVLACALVPFAAVAQNSVVNPGFDRDLSGWTLDFFNPSRSAVDADGSPNSGSATATVSGGSAVSGASLTQCFPADAGIPLDLSFKVMVANPPDTSRSFGGLQYYGNPNCTGTFLGVDVTPTPANLHLHTWQTLHVLATTPADTGSVLLVLQGTTGAGGSAQTISWDDVYLGPHADLTCPSLSTVLCLDGNSSGDRRFEAVATYHTVNGGGLSGSGSAISLSSLGVGQGGVFWFFDHSNPEMLVKVHNACASSNYYWIFVSAGTNAGVDLYVGDTLTGAVVLFHNPDLSSFPTIHDFLGLPCS